MTSSRIDPASQCRLPLVKRDDLDPRGQAVMDRQLDPARGSLVGMHGPVGIRLHSPVIAEHGQALINFYRQESVLDKRCQEVAILITARSHDSEFEWAAHDPAARRAGVPDATITAILEQAPTDGLDADDALIIDVGRQLFGKRHIDQDLYDRAATRFGNRGLVELVSLMAQYAGTAHLLAAFDMQLPAGKQPVMGS
jgi:4-carboxymuconolactone decarboxylase